MQRGKLYERVVQGFLVYMGTICFGPVCIVGLLLFGKVNLEFN